MRFISALVAGRTGPNPLVEVAPGQFCVGDRVVGKQPESLPR
jgi:hypothetical protein